MCGSQTQDCSFSFPPETGNCVNTVTGGTGLRIAIIGTGNVGSAMKGHDITLGAPNPQKAAVAASADLVILGLPWGAAEAAVKALGPLSGKTVIDCMNPPGMVGGTLGHTTSGGETVQGWLPGALIVKTLNQVGAKIMAKNNHLPLRPVMFMAANSAAAKHRLARLLADLAFAPLDAGDSAKSRHLEPFGMVWIKTPCLAARAGIGLARQVRGSPRTTPNRALIICTCLRACPGSGQSLQRGRQGCGLGSAIVL